MLEEKQQRTQIGLEIMSIPNPICVDIFTYFPSSGGLPHGAYA